MATIIATINDSKLSVEYDYLTSGNVGTIICNFTFDSSWNDFTKTVFFYQSDIYKESINLGVTGLSCDLPAYASAAVLPLYMGVYGTKTEEGINKRKIINYCQLKINEGLRAVRRDIDVSFNTSGYKW